MSKARNGQDDLGASELRALGGKYLFTGRYGAFDTGTEPPVIVRATGSYIIDAEGKEYLDVNAGQTCAALGHNDEAVVAAIKHATENAIHLAHAFPHKAEIFTSYQACLNRTWSSGEVSFPDVWCGRKRGSDWYRQARYGDALRSPYLIEGFTDNRISTRALTMTAGKRRGYPIRPTGIHSIMTPYCYRCPIQKTYPECKIACLDMASNGLMRNEFEELAAVITEPVFSAAGAIVPPKGWLAKLRDLAHERGARLIVDEVVMFARSGEWWAFADE